MQHYYREYSHEAKQRRGGYTQGKHNSQVQAWGDQNALQGQNYQGRGGVYSGQIVGVATRDRSGTFLEEHTGRCEGSLLPRRGTEHSGFIASGLFTLSRFGGTGAILYCISSSHRISASYVVGRTILSNGVITIPEYISTFKRVRFYHVSSIFSLRPKTFNVVRPGPSYRVVATFSGNVYVMPTLIFSRSKCHINFKGNCCSEFLRSFSNAGVKLTCRRRVVGEVPRSDCSVGSSVVISSGGMREIW